MSKRFILSLIVVTLLFAFAGSERAGAQGPNGGAVTVGKPWRGAPGVTQTVAQIMQREKNAPVAHQSSVRAITLRRQNNAKRASDSAAPSPSPAVSPNAPTRVMAPQTIGANFLGAQVSESGLIPPDSMGAVGPTQVMVVINGRIKLFDKSGTLGNLNLDLTTFFSPTLGSGAIRAFDPQARYDRLSGRWFITALDDSGGSGANRILIAASSSSTITDATSFTFFQFQHDLVGCPSDCPNSDTGAFADYESLGVDAHSLYIGINKFGSSVNATAFIVDKSDLLSATLTVTAFRSLIDGAAGPWSPRGVGNDDPSATAGYFIGTDYWQFGRLTLRRITYPGGVPSISGNITLTVPATNLPVNVLALGSTTPLDAIDDRLFDAQIKRNKITGADSMWTAHNIEVNATGVAASGGGRDGSRWYEIIGLSTTPTLYQSGTLYDSAASNPRSYWIPTVAATGQGHMALGASFASVNDYAGVTVAGRLFGDTLGTIQSPTIAQTGVFTYTLGPAPFRWGDYSMTAVDPNDDMTVWTFQEYANAANSWGVRVIQLIAPPPATILNACPSTIASGQSSVQVMVRGASTAGSGFFDPGLGFAQHLTATVSGGVAVNSILFVAPTQVTLDVSTLSAGLGAKNVTVTNPDGQVSTGVGALTVDAQASSCYHYIFPLIFR